MSYEASVFIKGPTGAELLRLLRDRLDTNLASAKREPNSPSVVQLFGLTLAVVDGHGLEDDGGIHFSNYEQQVSFTLYAGRLEPVTGRELCRSLALALAAVICEGARAECIVVEELQTILGEFRSEV